MCKYMQTHKHIYKDMSQVHLWRFHVFQTLLCVCVSRMSTALRFHECVCVCVCL